LSNCFQHYKKQIYVIAILFIIIGIFMITTNTNFLSLFNEKVFQQKIIEVNNDLKNPVKHDNPKPSEKTVPANNQQGRIICLDPGHQVKADPAKEPIGPGSGVLKEKDGGGTSGINSHTTEYQVNLEISFRLKKLLEDAGIKVIMTRTTNDVHLGNIDRANMANQSNADLFLRIHCDGSDNKTTSGTSVLYPYKNEWTEPVYQNSKLAASAIQESLVKECGRKNNGIVERGDMTGFNWSKVPVVIVEVAYMSNPEEDKLLNTPEFLQSAAQGIFNGVIGYFKLLDS